MRIVRARMHSPFALNLTRRSIIRYYYYYYYTHILQFRTSNAEHSIRHYHSKRRTVFESVRYIRISGLPVRVRGAPQITTESYRLFMTQKLLDQIFVNLFYHTLPKMH